MLMQTQKINDFIYTTAKVRTSKIDRSEMEECLYGQVYTRICENGHRDTFNTRCRLYKDCIACSRWRVRRIVAKGINRWDRLPHKPKLYRMWTFGTSLEDTVENRVVISGYWKKFTHQMRTYCKRKGFMFMPNMYGIENGSQGNRLHVHCLVFGYSGHKIILERWRKVTGENSNVNIARSRFRNDHRRAISYIAKYCGKSGGKYYWAGDLLRAREDEAPTPICGDCGGIYVVWVSRYQEMVRGSDFQDLSTQLLLHQYEAG